MTKKQKLMPSAPPTPLTMAPQLVPTSASAGLKRNATMPRHRDVTPRGDNSDASAHLTILYMEHTVDVPVRGLGTQQTQAPAQFRALDMPYIVPAHLPFDFPAPPRPSLPCVPPPQARADLGTRPLPPQNNSNVYIAQEAAEDADAMPIDDDCDLEDDAVNDATVLADTAPIHQSDRDEADAAAPAAEDASLSQRNQDDSHTQISTG